MKKKLILFIAIILLALPFAIYLYITEIQFELVNAYTPKSINGHSWSEIQCTEGLCVTTDNKVGIGTDTPTEKLEVVGDILVGDDACIGTGYCLSDLTGFF